MYGRHAGRASSDQYLPSTRLLVVIRKLPDLSPAQVVRLQDELLANADQLFGAAATLVQAGAVRLARSLAILGLEESGKAIAVHERRAQMAFIAEGSSFRCKALDELWASHENKLAAVYQFLVEERYWFGTGPTDPAETETILGSVQAWSRRNSKAKERGFYVELDSQGGVITPRENLEAEEVEKVLDRVHQIGWQLRMGEHIEGKRQDELEAGVAGEPNVGDDWLESAVVDPDLCREMQLAVRQGVPGAPLHNASYRFNPPGADTNPFRNVGSPGYEAEDRELAALWFEEYGEPEQG
ncbi:AbiV family abortive infection protein [uncultured Amnibacterium sp.]|uniref:AbiV family abortive infection protein n=1 Tax=uncultured Amnibacterium sp. TaxID=1631851 RepID=UPI0035CC9076